MPNLIHLGSEVKMTDKNEVQGYLVLFGSPDEADFVGDYFTKNTDFDLNPDGTGQATMYFNHGLDPVLKNHKLNGGIKAQLSIKDKGVWIEGKLDEANEYDAMVIELIKRRQSQGKSLGWSSGVPAHLVQREEVKTGISEIKAWSLGSDASLTHTPADYRNQATYKTIELLPIHSEQSIEGESSSTVKTDSVKTDGAGDAGDGSKSISENEVKEMPDQTKEKEQPQEEPQVQPVTLEAVKSLLDDFRKELFKEPEPNDPAIVNAPPVITAKRVNIQPNPIGGGDDNDGMKAFFHYLRTGQVNSSLVEAKALEGGTDSEGGYTVPSPQHNTIIQRRDLASIVRTAPGFSMFTTTATTYDIPLEGDDSAAMDETAEEANAVQNDPVFGNAAGVITKYTREIRVSDELLDDNSANLQQFLDSRVGREMAKAENAALHTALFAGGTAALTLDSNSAIAASEIPEITGLLPASWEAGAIWNMKKSTGSLIRALQGNDFLFMPMPSAMGGNGNRWILDDAPVYYNDQMDAMGSDNQVITYYNPEAVGVIDRQGMTMLRDPYSLSTSGQVKLVYKFRFDVIVLQAQGVLEIICPT